MSLFPLIQFFSMFLVVELVELVLEELLLVSRTGMVLLCFIFSCQFPVVRCPSVVTLSLIRGSTGHPDGASHSGSRHWHVRVM